MTEVKNDKTFKTNISICEIINLNFGKYMYIIKIIY